MGISLTDEDIKWLGEKFPSLSHVRGPNRLVGDFHFSAKYKNLETIDDCYSLIIDLNESDSSGLPRVYEIGARIKKIAKIQNKKLLDLHQYPNNQLCLIHPSKVHSWYKNGVDLRSFMDNLTTHLYWISYVDRYNKEPWPGEKHGY